MSRSNCCFLTCIQISQEAGQVVWYSHFFKNFPQYLVIHTVKGFGIVSRVEVFLELSCFSDDPTDVGNLISGSPAFSKSTLNMWKFTVHILLKFNMNFIWSSHEVWCSTYCCSPGALQLPPISLPPSTLDPWSECTQRHTNPIKSLLCLRPFRCSHLSIKPYPWAKMPCWVWSLLACWHWKSRGIWMWQTVSATPSNTEKSLQVRGPTRARKALSTLLPLLILLDIRGHLRARPRKFSLSSRSSQSQNPNLYPRKPLLFCYLLFKVAIISPLAVRPQPSHP